MDDSWKPDFALQNSVRWPAALAILCDQGQFGDDELDEFYKNVPRRQVDTSGDSLAFEALLMAFHNFAAVSRIASSPDTVEDLIRLAAVSWYYGVYYGASAMVAASDSSRQENHAATARTWGRQVVSQECVVAPFSYHTSSLVKKVYEAEIDVLRGSNGYSLNDEPVDVDTAYGGALSYIKGTAKRDRELIEARIRDHRDFRALGAPNFRSKIAREFRDRQLDGRQTNFLNQAIRYRGKASYRDSVYLSYGQPRPAWFRQLSGALLSTLSCFLKMACRYCERRVERGVWDTFVLDMESHCLFELDRTLLKRQ